MKRELMVNAWKGDSWRTISATDLATEVIYHALKVAVAVGLDSELRDSAILEMCADVGNCAAMLADAIHALDEQPEPVPEYDSDDEMRKAQMNGYVGHSLGTVDLRKWAAELTEGIIAGRMPTTVRRMHGPERAPVSTNVFSVSDLGDDDIPF